jgi:ParB/RepB/Spo0J family partition protein
VEDPENLGDLCSSCLKTDNVWSVPLDAIRPAPWNPPSRMDPVRVKELADSIRQEGQQSAAKVRPVEAEAPVKYELVFGHRRYAAKKLLSEKVDAAYAFLRCKVEEMSEEQAMISSGIENLQREGFSDIEEAEFFRTCSAHYGESAVKMLAEKLSVSNRYIRKRIEILKLPEAALELWRSGTWHFGHMEQLLRLGENETVSAFLEKFDSRAITGLLVWQLKDLVNRRAIALHAGSFDKAECKTCRKNTDCQLRLFGGEKDKGAKCLDQHCFKQKQEAWLAVNWPTCKANKFGTQVAVIGDYNTPNTGSLSGDPRPAEKCASCPQFATILRLDGSQNYESQKKVCLGKSDCYAELKKATKKSQAANKVVAEPDTPRVAWHGEFYRQEFYRQEIPRLLAELPPGDPRRLQLALATFVCSAQELHLWFLKKVDREDLQVGADSWFRLPFSKILQLAMKFDGLQAEQLMAEALCEIALHTSYGNGNWNCRLIFEDSGRQALAEFLNIDFSRYVVTEEYLQKKTKPELVRFIVHDSGLWQTPEFKDGMIRQGLSSALTPEQLAAQKKPALVDLLLNCGVDLHGRLPKEIADRPNLAEG